MTFYTRTETPHEAAKTQESMLADYFRNEGALTVGENISCGQCLNATWTVLVNTS